MRGVLTTLLRETIYYSGDAFMSTKSADYMTAIRQRAAEYLPDILELLKAREHPRGDEVQNAVVEAAVVYFRLSQPQSRKRKAAMKKIGTDARRLRAALAPRTLTDDEREELHAIVDAHLRSYPANTLGKIFAKSCHRLRKTHCFPLPTSRKCRQ